MIGRRQASRYGAGTLCGQAFKPVPLASRFMTPARSVGTGTHAPATPRTQPPTGITRPWFGLIRFRSPLLTEYPFLQVLRCFTSLRTPGTNVPCRPMTAGGLPHSEILGSKPCWRLPEAYRILKRPSSVLSAKASTIRPSGRHTPRKNLMIAFLRQTTNHHTVKNDHKTIDLETRLIQKRRAWRNRDKANDETEFIALLASTIQFSNHHAPKQRPGQGTPAGRPPKGTSGKPHATKSRVAVREPKSIPIPLPAGPQRNPRSQRSLPHQHAHTRTGEHPRRMGHTTDDKPSS